MTAKTQIRLLTALAIVNLVWDGLLYLQTPKDTVGNYLFNLAYGALWAFGGVAGMARARAFGFRSAVGKAFAFFSLALLVSALGQAIWTYYNLAEGIEVPVMTLADLAWYAAYPCIAAGAVLLFRVNPLKIDPWRAGLSLLLPVAFLFFAGRTFLPLLQHTDELAVAAVNSLYVAFDGITVSLILLALAVYGGRIGTFLLVFLTGTLLWAMADLLYFWRSEAETYWNGGVVDSLFAASAYVQAYALIALSPSVPAIAAAPPSYGGPSLPRRDA